MDLDCDMLYREYASYLRHFIRRRVKSDEEAEEVVQNTFVKVLTTTSEFRGESTVKTWLISIALNESSRRYKHLACRGADITVSDDTVSELDYHRSALDVYDTVADRDQIRVLDMAISKLAPECQDVLENVILDDEPYQDAAKRLNIPVGTIRSRVFRTREFLQNRLSRG